MPKIKLLEEALINKIAAGEVIERPASIVKELVENSIDAGATEITIELMEGGKSEIKITDNGYGMSKEDAVLSIQRHATSKISSTDDLFNIHTLGFRGEALASIAAVADVSLKTKTKEELTGIKVLISAGKIIETEEVAIKEGTSITVQNLFSTIPARKKHLKTMQTELRQATELITKYCLAHPHITFRLLHNTQELLFAPATENTLDRILTVYGTKIGSGMLAVAYEEKGIKINGHISKPTLTRNDASIQHIFVNTRAVKNSIITKAVTDAYHTLLHLDNYPLFVLHVYIDPALIDVNVHPQKATIRVEKEQELYTAVYNAVRQTLMTSQLIPVLTEESTKSIQAPLFVKQTVIETEKQQFFAAESFSKTEEQTVAQEIFERALQRFSNIEEKTAQQEPQPEKMNQRYQIKLLGCVHKVFYLAENELGLLIIDQHAAHERVLYEKFMEMYRQRNITTQELLVPEELEFSPTEMIIIKEHKKVVEQLGFMLEEFGRNTMLLRTVPAVFGKYMNKEMIHEILFQLQERTTALDAIKEEKIIRTACRAAVKAHDVVHIPEMQQILEQLQQCQQPFTCPHGRPTMIQFSIPDLEKKFKRVV